MWGVSDNVFWVELLKFYLKLYYWFIYFNEKFSSLTDIIHFQIASRLEAANKVKEPLKSDLLNGK